MQDRPVSPCRVHSEQGWSFRLKRVPLVSSDARTIPTGTKISTGLLERVQFLPDPTYEGSGLGAYDRLFHTHGESPSDWYYTMGQINYAGNLAVSASTSSRKKYYWETYNLIGDPSVIPIMGKPGTFSFALPDTLPNGIKSLSLKGDPFAYVAVSHSDTLWDATFTSNSGAVVLEMPGLSNDSCLVVITGQNKIPVIKTIYFSDIQNEFINLTAHSINDSPGNNNHAG